MAILVTGGAGYIGSHTVFELLKQNEQVVVVDHLGQGHPEAVQGCRLWELDIRDSDATGWNAYSGKTRLRRSSTLRLFAGRGKYAKSGQILRQQRLRDALSA